MSILYALTAPAILAYGVVEGPMSHFSQLFGNKITIAAGAGEDKQFAYIISTLLLRQALEQEVWQGEKVYYYADPVCADLAGRLVVSPIDVEGMGFMIAQSDTLSLSAGWKKIMRLYNKRLYLTYYGPKKGRDILGRIGVISGSGDARKVMKRLHGETIAIKEFDTQKKALDALAKGHIGVLAQWRHHELLNAGPYNFMGIDDVDRVVTLFPEYQIAELEGVLTLSQSVYMLARGDIEREMLDSVTCRMSHSNLQQILRRAFGEINVQIMD